MSLARSMLSRWPMRPNFEDGRGSMAGVGSKSEAPTLLVWSPPVMGVPAPSTTALTLPTVGEATPSNRRVKSMALLLTGRLFPVSEVSRLSP